MRSRQEVAEVATDDPRPLFLRAQCCTEIWGDGPGDEIGTMANYIRAVDQWKRENGWPTRYGPELKAMERANPWSRRSCGPWSWAEMKAEGGSVLADWLTLWSLPPTWRPTKAARAEADALLRRWRAGAPD